jgi:large subunit ribosomal protein L19
MAKATKTISPIDMAKRTKLDLRPGNTVRVWQKIQEKGKTRLQAYEGLIIARKHGAEAGATFTVRKVASGVGMEKIFPVYSPNIDKIEILKSAKVRRAKLYYIRDKAAREVRRRMKRIGGFVFTPDEVAEMPEEAPALKAEEAATVTE